MKVHVTEVDSEKILQTGSLIDSVWFRQESVIWLARQKVEVGGQVTGTIDNRFEQGTENMNQHAYDPKDVITQKNVQVLGEYCLHKKEHQGLLMFQLNFLGTKECVVLCDCTLTELTRSTRLG
ncbi:hypothetical protein Tco_0991371 [Tanacetum coccineum]|uniref:Uncharacterized protein n=1 Tax=Tanacetum coccineum TaxID=301880 RepID=A0ABQ5F0J9_9ASTR